MSAAAAHLAGTHLLGGAVFVVACLCGLYALSAVKRRPGWAGLGCVLSSALFAFSFVFLAL